MTYFFIYLHLLLFSCTYNKNYLEEHNDNFATDTSIKITTPSNGDIVENTFTLVYESGGDVDHAILNVNDEQVEKISDPSIGMIEVTLADGSSTLQLIAMDSQNNQLSTYSITIIVNPEGDWVTIISPTNGSTVTNPVYFTINSSETIETIEIFADDWSLGSISPGEILQYEFSGTGFERAIEAVASVDGLEVANDNISITVEQSSIPFTSEFNSYVLDIIDTYPTDGTYTYDWNNYDGTTQNLYYQDTLIAQGDPNSTCFCSGITFETFMRAWGEVNIATNSDGTINGMTIEDLFAFRTDWYVRDLLGSGPSVAVDNYGIGEEITNWTDIESGDFIQFWRHSGSGHTVVFIDWEYDAQENIIGFYYWSSQSSTDGIGYRSEYFGVSGSEMDPQYFYAARIYMPEDWIPW
jgi:hypothetical protein